MKYLNDTTDEGSSPSTELRVTSRFQDDINSSPDSDTNWERIKVARQTKNCIFKYYHIALLDDPFWRSGTAFEPKLDAKKELKVDMSIFRKTKTISKFY